MGRKKTEDRAQLVWAIEYVVNYLNHDGVKQDWLGSLNRDHIWHPVRVLRDWLEREDTPDEDEAAQLMAEAAKESEREEVTYGDLTEEEILERRVEERANAKMAAWLAAKEQDAKQASETTASATVIDA
jgi:hypothetical protein